MIKKPFLENILPIMHLTYRKHIIKTIKTNRIRFERFLTIYLKSRKNVWNYEMYVCRSKSQTIFFLLVRVGTMDFLSKLEPPKSGDSKTYLEKLKL